jgi:hypothetical protein
MEKQRRTLERSRQIVEATSEKESKETLEERGTQVSRATVEGQECSRLDSADN